MQILQYVNTTTVELAETRGAADMALQLFLTAAHAATEVDGLDDLAYELFEQVLPMFVADGLHNRVHNLCNRTLAMRC